MHCTLTGLADPAPVEGVTALVDLVRASLTSDESSEFARFSEVRPPEYLTYEYMRVSLSSWDEAARPSVVVTRPSRLHGSDKSLESRLLESLEHRLGRRSLVIVDLLLSPQPLHQSVPTITEHEHVEHCIP